MLKKYFPDSSASDRLLGYFLLGSLVFLALFFAIFVEVKYTGRRQGIYLLKSPSGFGLHLKDDLFLNEGNRLIYAFDLKDHTFGSPHLFKKHKQDESYLYYEWDAKDGSGYVRNFLPGGRRIRTNFCRFSDDFNKYPHGLFVGGGLPENVKSNDVRSMDNVRNLDGTGMSYFDGQRHYHIWCTANEVIDSTTVVGEQIYPSKMKYLGSKIISASDKELVIKSSHKMVLDGVPMRMERTASFMAGETYFILSVKMTNIGNGDVSFYYSYGDEPWLGDYGSSAGNVGWTQDGLVKYTHWLDTKKYNYAGYFDYGNDAAGEGHYFTNVADFIQWFGPDRPQVFFSNGANDFPAMDDKIPLASNERFICLQWGPETLKPGQSVEHMMAIGMAGNDPATGFPVKPEIRQDPTLAKR